MNAFEEIKKRIKPMVRGGMRGPQWIPFRGLIEMLDDVEKEYNNGWIPCSERLPKSNTAVLVATNTGEIDVDYYGTYCGDFIGLKGTHMKAIAWQPLPPAYKEEV